MNFKLISTPHIETINPHHLFSTLIWMDLGLSLASTLVSYNQTSADFWKPTFQEFEVNYHQWGDLFEDNGEGLGIQAPPSDRCPLKSTVRETISGLKDLVDFHLNVELSFYTDSELTDTQKELFETLVACWTDFKALSDFDSPRNGFESNRIQSQLREALQAFDAVAHDIQTELYEKKAKKAFSVFLPEAERIQNHLGFLGTWSKLLRTIATHSDTTAVTTLIRHEKYLLLKQHFHRNPKGNHFALWTLLSKKEIDEEAYRLAPIQALRRHKQTLLDRIAAEEAEILSQNSNSIRYFGEELSLLARLLPISEMAEPAARASSELMKKSLNKSLSESELQGAIQLTAIFGNALNYSLQYMLFGNTSLLFLATDLITPTIERLPAVSPYLTRISTPIQAILDEKSPGTFLSKWTDEKALSNTASTLRPMMSFLPLVLISKDWTSAGISVLINLTLGAIVSVVDKSVLKDQNLILILLVNTLIRFLLIKLVLSLDFSQAPGPSSQDIRNAKTVLGLEGDPECEAIRLASKKLQIKHHPDRCNQSNSTCVTAATARSAEINAASDVLKTVQNCK